MKRCVHLLWVTVPVLLMATATACRAGDAKAPSVDATSPPPAQTLPADDAEFLDPPDGGLAAIANGGVTALDPAVAQLVGPTYGVAFEATGIATSIEELTYARMSGLAEDVGAASRGARVPAPGHEFLLAMVTQQELPTPTLGPPSQPFASWQISVDDAPRQIRSHHGRTELTNGMVILVSVPVGQDAVLSATVDGQTGKLSLRTGQLMVSM